MYFIPCKIEYNLQPKLFRVLCFLEGQPVVAATFGTLELKKCRLLCGLFSYAMR